MLVALLLQRDCFFFAKSADIVTPGDHRPSSEHCQERVLMSAEPPQR
jgi:hypothetical protein